ncbi:helix-turn-helix and ligand-binding sensor domain-containing protein [Flavobacterium psychrotrophum]|uniref:helix-turn-helix and ligand-binding sensor domain-containing protein n=1 Tax=Flavobacterium psychrotrophum TaxID=2294119 RepID=UPI001F08B4A9|nr:triple tyrosine motif-containing protein [Flavobacterium psychrotrophum]
MKKITLIFIIFSFLTSFSQDLPPILKYTAGNYAAGNQNWMISQDNNGYLYFANNEGLLEYNGTSWSLYPTPNETIMRSVKVIGNRIYCGFYMDFGYWSRKTDGTLAYTSLTKKIRNKIIDDEQFWNIAQYDRWIIFQSLSRIFIYDTKTSNFNIIHSDTGMNKVFTANNTILYQAIGSGLFEIENGQSRLVSDAPILSKSKIVNIYGRDDSYLIITQYDGFYELKNGVLTRWNIAADADLNTSSIYSSQLLSDGSFALGTVSNGIFIITQQGNVKYHITQNKGLSNNTALSMYEDEDNNLWLGLDNGINCINMQSVVHNYADDTGFLGTVYTSLLHNELLYIGTNQGLFCKPYNSSADFKFIPGTKGQVWSLFLYDDTLFCGHDYGTYVVKGTLALPIFTGIGTWKFEPHPTNKNLIIQGNYQGLSILEKTATGWKYRNKIAGFDNSSRFFAVRRTNEIYVSHEYKGIYRVVIDPGFTTTKKVITYKEPSKGKNVSLVTFNNKVYYASKEGIFMLNDKTKQFEMQGQLSKIFNNDEYTSGKLIPDSANRLWFFTKNYINYLSSGKLNTDLKHNIIPIPSSLTNSMLGYENITQISPSVYLIGTTDGYYTINLHDISFKKYRVFITNITANAQNKNPFNVTVSGEGSLDYSDNNLTFNYTLPEYNKYVNSEFQYLLEGVQDDWSEWSGRSTVSFKNLPAGEYTFKVRAKAGNSLSTNTANYTFTILKPWYATNLAITIYLILAIIAAFLINRAYKNYYQQQHEKLIEENNRLLEIKELENEQELMRVKNDQLQQEFENKNRELAVSTMNLIKKNELLSTIKDDLKKTTEGDKSFKSVITTINKNINEDDTWDMFKEAFNNADKDFLKKIKKAHPALTPNDLRLCAYLRLNLSSKEIAPLLNISVRSVEIKRYRLRKKMDLLHELSLVEYILSI